MPIHFLSLAPRNISIQRILIARSPPQYQVAVPMARGQVRETLIMLESKIVKQEPDVHLTP